MKVPGIEEIARTYWSSKRLASDVSWDEMVARSDARSKRIVSEIRAGLLAVFETHVKGMLAEAYVAGVKDPHAKLASAGLTAASVLHAREAEVFAETAIAQLKEPRHD